MHTLLKLISIKHNICIDTSSYTTSSIQEDSRIGLGSFAPNVSQKWVKIDLAANWYTTYIILIIFQQSRLQHVTTSISHIILFLWQQVTHHTLTIPVMDIISLLELSSFHSTFNYSVWVGEFHGYRICKAAYNFRTQWHIHKIALLRPFIWYQVWLIWLIVKWDRGWNYKFLMKTAIKVHQKWSSPSQIS